MAESTLHFISYYLNFYIILSVQYASDTDLIQQIYLRELSMGAKNNATNSKRQCFTNPCFSWFPPLFFIYSTTMWLSLVYWHFFLGRVICLASYLGFMLTESLWISCWERRFMKGAVASEQQRYSIPKPREMAFIDTEGLYSCTRVIRNFDIAIYSTLITVLLITVL